MSFVHVLLHASFSREDCETKISLKPKKPVILILNWFVLFKRETPSLRKIKRWFYSTLLVCCTLLPNYTIQTNELLPPTNCYISFIKVKLYWFSFIYYIKLNYAVLLLLKQYNFTYIILCVFCYRLSTDQWDVIFIQGIGVS